MWVLSERNDFKANLPKLEKLRDENSWDEGSSMGIDHEDASNIPKAEENVEDASARWLRGEWEYLQRKRAKGRELDDYEKGLEKKYEEQQEK